GVGLAWAAAPLGLALVAGLAGPAAYALDTVGTAHTRAIPRADPAPAGFGGGPGGGPRGPTRPRPASVGAPAGVPAAGVAAPVPDRPAAARPEPGHPAQTLRP